MARRGSRIAALLAVALLLSAKSCYHAVEEANEIDDERIEMMRTDPIYAHVTDEQIREGSLHRYSRHSREHYGTQPNPTPTSATSTHGSANHHQNNPPSPSPPTRSPPSSTS